MANRKFIFIPIAVVALICILEQQSGCRKDETPLSPAPCGDRNRTPYGTGSISFAFNAGGDSILYLGQYVSSDQFINDTIARRGVGGFVHDTLVALKPLKGMVVGFLHSLHSGIFYDTVLVLRVYNNSGPIALGDYAFAKSNANPSGKYSNVILLATDALHQYSIFEAKDGKFTLSLFDTCNQKLKGTFAGTLWDRSDTSKQIQLDNGKYDVKYVDHYFNY